MTVVLFSPLIKLKPEASLGFIGEREPSRSYLGKGTSRLFLLSHLFLTNLLMRSFLLQQQQTTHSEHERNNRWWRTKCTPNNRRKGDEKKAIWRRHL